jgi:hypothetical protein
MSLINLAQKKELMMRLTRYVTIACLGFVYFSATGCADWRTSRAINSFFREVALSGPSKNYDLRSVIPADWQEVCIAYFPYAEQSHIEEKFGGKIRGEYQITFEDQYMLLGINANNEITQVVLDGVGSFLANHFRFGVWRRANCVSREQAVLISRTSNGQQYLTLGDFEKGDRDAR